MGDEEGDALPQRLNSRQRWREQQQHGQEEGEGLAVSGVADGAAPQEPSTSRRQREARRGHGLAEGSSEAAPPGPGRGPESESEAADDDSGKPGPGSEPAHEPGGSGAGIPGVEVEAVSTLEPLPEYRSAAVGNYKFEYLDHTADVQLHAWGSDLAEAFEQCGLALFNYMSPLEHVRRRETRTYRAEGHDLASLLFGFLDELLFEFNTELFLAAQVRITRFDRQAFVIEAEGHGERFDRSRHEVGTEVKAITYSAMSIAEAEGDAEVFVIVDI